MPNNRNINETEGLYYRMTLTNTLTYEEFERQKRGRTQRESNEKMVRRMKYESQKEKLDI